jgi:hypothetical protein
MMLNFSFDLSHFSAQSFFLDNRLFVTQFSSAKICASWLEPGFIRKATYILYKGIFFNHFVVSDFQKEHYVQIFCAAPPKKYRLGGKVFG